MQLQRTAASFFHPPFWVNLPPQKWMSAARYVVLGWSESNNKIASAYHSFLQQHWWKPVWLLDSEGAGSQKWALTLWHLQISPVWERQRLWFEWVIPAAACAHPNQKMIPKKRQLAIAWLFSIANLQLELASSLLSINCFFSLI